MHEHTVHTESHIERYCCGPLTFFSRWGLYLDSSLSQEVCVGSPFSLCLTFLLYGWAHYYYHEVNHNWRCLNGQVQCKGDMYHSACNSKTQSLCSRAWIEWAGFRQIQQFMLILIIANRAVHATLKAQNTQGHVSDKSSSLYFPLMSLFLVLLPLVAPSFTLIQWRNFTRQVIKDQSHDARCGCSFNWWQPPSNFSPLPFLFYEKKEKT